MNEEDTSMQRRALAGLRLFELTFGELFTKQAPFPDVEWKALMQIGSCVNAHGLQVLFRVPLSRLVPRREVQEDELTLWATFPTLAVAIGNPPEAAVHAVVLDKRDSRSNRVASQLERINCPYVWWTGEHDQATVLQELAAILPGAACTRTTRLFNGREFLASNVLGRAITGRKWSAIDLVSKQTLEEFTRLAEGDSQPDATSAVQSPRTIWIFGEVALSTVIGEAQGHKQCAPWLEAFAAAAVREIQSPSERSSLESLVALEFQKCRSLRERSSLDFVVFLEGLEQEPLFALEVDGSRHDEPGQQERDRRKDFLCESAGIPLVRVRASAIPKAIENEGLESASCIVSVNTLLPILIQTFLMYLIEDRQQFEAKRIAIAAKERAAFLKALAIEGISLREPPSRLSEIEEIRRRARSEYEPEWGEYWAYRDYLTAEHWCTPVLPEMSPQERAGAIAHAKRMSQGLGREFPPQFERSPLPWCYHWAQSGLALELEELGWAAGDIRFQASDSGTRAMLEMKRVGMSTSGASQESVLRTGVLKLTGTSRHVDLRAVETEVAALTVMYAARNRARSGR